MRPSRILIKQDDVKYRFVRFDQLNDGSVIVAVDRSKVNLTHISPKWTIHTSGVVNYHIDDIVRAHIIDPLYCISEEWSVGVISVPRANLLTPLGSSRVSEVEGTIDIPVGYNERLTFEIIVGPPLHSDVQPQSYFRMTMTFQTYAVTIAQSKLLFNLGDDMNDQFIYGSFQRPAGTFGEVDKRSAELLFFEKVNGPGPKLFRKNDGSYVLMTDTNLEMPRDFKIEFDRADLSADVINSGPDRRHKIHFWICDRGGRNKVDDLSKHIIPVILHRKVIGT